jgi:hypothetical protein
MAVVDLIVERIVIAVGSVVVQTAVVGLCVVVVVGADAAVVGTVADCKSPFSG